jgi:hypothetical protein
VGACASIVTPVTANAYRTHHNFLKFA